MDYFGVTLLLFFVLAHEANGDGETYNDNAQTLLQSTLSRRDNHNIAKNVVLIVGDGMSLATVAAARVLKGQRAGRTGVGEEMLYETFPNIGLARTYATDKYVPDSASTATAFLCGVKTKYEGVGVDDTVRHSECPSLQGARVRCIGEWAMQAGKSVGLVTNMRVTHATPAPLYAHAPDRWWESDANIKGEEGGGPCKDIARQLVEDYPGRNIQVILGGGREVLMPNTTFDPEYPERRGKRGDHRRLIDDWRRHKERAELRHKYVWNKRDFDRVDPKKTDYLLGLFEPAHLYDVTDRDSPKSDFREPTLAEMTQKAIEVLDSNPRGYFLLVEGGLIDKRHHAGRAVRAVGEALDLEGAVETALRKTSREDTLVVVTSDHSQGMNFVGYADVGKDIFGVADVSNVDGMPYTTLMYSSGPGYKMAADGRANITGVDTGHVWHSTFRTLVLNPDICFSPQGLPAASDRATLHGDPRWRGRRRIRRRPHVPSLPGRIRPALLSPRHGVRRLHWTQQGALQGRQRIQDREERRAAQRIGLEVVDSCGNCDCILLVN